MNEQNEHNEQMNVTLEIVVVFEDDLRLVRELFPEAEESEEVVWPMELGGFDTPGMLLGQAHLQDATVDFNSPSNVRGWVLREKFATIEEARQASRSLPYCVAVRIQAQLVLDEGQLESLVEHHSRQSMLVEPRYRQLMSFRHLESVVEDTYKYHRERLHDLEALLGKDRVNSIVSEMRDLYDPVTGTRKMDACELRLVAGFKSLDPPKEHPIWDLIQPKDRCEFDDEDDDRGKSETVH